MLRRPNLQQYHDYQLRLDGHGGWKYLTRAVRATFLACSFTPSDSPRKFAGLGGSRYWPVRFCSAYDLLLLMFVPLADVRAQEVDKSPLKQ